MCGVFFVCVFVFNLSVLQPAPNYPLPVPQEVRVTS